MRKFSFFSGLLALSFLLISGYSAHAAQPLAHNLPLKPNGMLSTTPTAQQIGQQLQTLMGNPAMDTPDDQKDAEDTTPNELAPTFGTKALNFVIKVSELLRAQGENFITNFAALPELSGWYDQQSKNPRMNAQWQSIGHDLRDCVIVPLAAALAFDFLLFVPRVHLRRRHPPTLSGCLAIVLSLLGLRALPIALFIGLSVTFLDQNEVQKLPRYLMMNIIYALALSRIGMTILRGILAPGAAQFRFLPISNDYARYAYRWLSAFGLIIIYGYFAGDLARAIHMPAAAVLGFGNILALLLVVMMITIIVQKRAVIATLFRGDLSAAQLDLTLWQLTRLWLGRNWHVLTITYLVIGYLIAALGVADGLIVMLRGTILTFLILIGMRLLFTVADRWARVKLSGAFTLHHAITRGLLHIAVWMAAVLALAAAWGTDIPGLFQTPIGQRILGSAFSIGSTIAILAVLYEVFSLAVDKHLNKRAEDDRAAPSARARTLLPMIRHTLFIILVVIVAVVVLSEAGVNIGPLLAGAGVLGVAVGFGSQTLVKDFLTGLFIVIENIIAVGDVVKIGEFSGVVEALSVRTIRLRDQDGSLHILPFGEVSKLTNMSKDFAFALISISVAYNTDLEHAMQVMREVGDDLQKDPLWKRVIVEPTEILGVEKFGDFSVTLVARLRTRPGKQWDVKRMFLLRLKQRFDKEKIEIPFPTVTSIHQNALPSGVDGI